MKTFNKGAAHPPRGEPWLAIKPSELCRRAGISTDAAVLPYTESKKMTQDSHFFALPPPAQSRSLMIRQSPAHFLTLGGHRLNLALIELVSARGIGCVIVIMASGERIVLDATQSARLLAALDTMEFENNPKGQPTQQ